MLPKPVSTIARASGRLRFSADTTSRPLPSPSRKSTTAKGGAARPICARPSVTLSQEVTEKPRVSMARERRSRNGLSSSTISRERSVCSVSSTLALTIRVSLICDTQHMEWQSGAAKAAQSRSPVAPAGSRRTGPGARPGRRQDCPNKTVLRCWFGSNFAGLETVARPGDLNHRAMIGKDAVGEGDFGAGALQQGAGDKDPETEAPPVPVLALVGAAPPRQIGLADSLQYDGREARSLVGKED